MSNNPYYNNNSYELSNYNKYSSGSDDLGTFMNEIHDINSSLDQYSNLIGLIDKKQQNLINEVDLNEADTEYNTQQIDNLVNEATTLQANLKERIKQVQTQAVKDHDRTKQEQAEVTKRRFLELIQNYRLIESKHKEQSKVQSERQYRIIRPEASEQEIQQVVESGDPQQYFQQALLQSNRRGEARVVLNEVQVRHQELLKLEKTMAELTQLVHDMEELVVEQDQQIQQIDETVHQAQHDIEGGLGHTEKAVKSARAARKKKIWCAIIVTLIIVILALILGLYFGLHN
ncbi:t-SNARE [Scheffersomyces amazonensis]|uniref:t-SNARE n=1 Tax=Scheffersomyces amazonensis TaxID=1078765 RepID=UPI00315C9EE5